MKNYCKILIKEYIVNSMKANKQFSIKYNKLKQQKMIYSKMIIKNIKNKRKVLINMSNKKKNVI